MNSAIVDSDFMSSIFKNNLEMLSNTPKNPILEEFFDTPDFVDTQNLPFEQNGTAINSEAHDLGELNTLSIDQNDCYNCSSEIPDFPDHCLKFISDILLEEDLDEDYGSAQDYTTLQATEKSLYDVLGESNPHSSDCFPGFQNQSPDSSSSNKSYRSVEPNLSVSPPELDPIADVNDSGDGVVNVASELSSAIPEAEKGKKTVKGSRRKKKSCQSDETSGGGRSNKIRAPSGDDNDYVEMKEYDDVLLCCEGKDDAALSPDKECSMEEKRGKKLSKKTGGGRSSKGDGKKQIWRGKNFDLKTASDLLKQIRQHCSPYGDSIQRLAHHVANGLETRLAGTGSTVSTNVCDMKISSSDFLKAYRLYVSAIPFRRMSFFLANNTIFKLAEKATKIHVIDFGILLGLQRPCFIQALSRRPNGPPKLRITGIDFPQQGFRPAERVDATGRRLSGYCERFGVPFQYQGIADKWENIQPQDLKIENDEMVIVNCMFRSRTLLDETVEANSPRDAFLRLIRNLNPHLFIHAIVNGTCTALYFMNRFKEALFHYSSVFEVCDATLPRDSHERLLIESEIHGKEVINVIACEGVERVQRAETYKMWQVGSVRAGLRQVPFDREFYSKTKAMVRANYHKDFLVDEDKNWILQGWMGRIFCALSFWQPSS
ncbi:Scarecrow-like protein 14 [Bienertia sinuspersici]